MNFRLSCPLVLAAVLLIGSAAAVAEDEAPEKKITYDDNVQSIFREKCGLCHNPDDAENDLVVLNYGRLMQGGASGVAIVPGDPDGSRLWKLVSHQEEPNMPPEADKLDDASLETIKKWISGGALENAGSKAMLPKKPAIDLTATAGTGQGEGEAIVPEGLSRQPVVYTDRAGALTAVAASPWAPIVAIAGQKQILIYNTDSAELIGVLPFPEGIAHVLKFSRNGSLLLAGGGHASKAGHVVLFDVKTGKRVMEVGDELDAVLAADINENHTLVALGGPNRVVRVYSTADGSLLHEIRKHTDWIYAIEFSPDGVLLTTADRSGGLFVWEADTAREYLNLRGHGGGVRDVSWRLDSNLLASCGEDGSVRLWEMNNGKQVKSWTAHGGGTQSVKFARDGRLLTSGRDRTIKIWDVEGKELANLGAFNDLALGAVFTHDGARVVAGDWTGEIRLMEVEGAKQIAHLVGNPPTLEMRAEAAVQQAATVEAEAAKLASELAAAEKVAAEKATVLKQAADALAANQSAQAEAVKQQQTAAQMVEAKKAAVAAAVQQLEDAKAALAAAQTEQAAADKDALAKATAAQTATEKATAAKAAVDQATADKQALDQTAAEKAAQAKAAAEAAARAKEAAEKAAAELAAHQANQSGATETEQASAAP